MQGLFEVALGGDRMDDGNHGGIIQCALSAAFIAARDTDHIPIPHVEPTDPPHLLLTLTTLFWSGNMVLGRAIRADIPPMTLAFWRWAIALALVLPLALPHLRSQWPQLRKGWKPVLILGVLGVGGYNTLAYVALQYTAATNAVLLNSFIPIATIALSWLFLKKHLRRIEGHRCRTVVRRGGDHRAARAT